MQISGMQEVNEELEGNNPRWDSTLGQWIEPDEMYDEPKVPASLNDWLKQSTPEIQ